MKSHTDLSVTGVRDVARHLAEYRADLAEQIDATTSQLVATNDPTISSSLRRATRRLLLLLGFALVTATIATAGFIIRAEDGRTFEREAVQVTGEVVERATEYAPLVVTYVLDGAKHRYEYWGDSDYRVGRKVRLEVLDRRGFVKFEGEDFEDDGPEFAAILGTMAAVPAFLKIASQTPVLLSQRRRLKRQSLVATRIVQEGSGWRRTRRIVEFEFNSTTHLALLRRVDGTSNRVDDPWAYVRWSDQLLVEDTRDARGTPSGLPRVGIAGPGVPVKIVTSRLSLRHRWWRRVLARGEK